MESKYIEPMSKVLTDMKYWRRGFWDGVIAASIAWVIVLIIGLIIYRLLNH